MNKLSTKKMLTVLISLAMVFSALAVISMAAEPAYATSSGTVTYNPTTFGVNPSTNVPITTVAFVSGGTFSSGATIYFYLSTKDSYTGLISDYSIGQTTLTASSPTSLDQAATFFPNPSLWLSNSGLTSLSPNTYYILATNAAPPLIASEIATLSWAFPSTSSQFVPQTASIDVLNAVTQSPALMDNALNVGGTALVLGRGWDSGASVNIYLNYPGSSVLLGTASANSFGVIQTTFTVPNLSGTVEMNFAGVATRINNPYVVVAQEMNPYTPITFPQGGITADGAMDVAPSITVSPPSISTSSGATLTVTGTGFPADGLIPASTSVTPNSYIQIYSYNYNALSSALPVTILYSGVNVSETGQFTVTLTIENSLASYGTGPYGISITMNDKNTIISPVVNQFYPAFYVSSPNTQELGFFFELPLGAPNYPTNPVMGAVFDFPASAHVSVYIGASLVGNITTDNNGFGALPASATIPAMPAGTYSVVAVDSAMNLVVSPTIGSKTIAISPFFMAVDPAMNLLTAGNTGTLAPYNNNEYVPQNGTITVIAYGLTPMSVYNAFDTAVGSVFPTYVTAIQIGTPYDSLGIIPAANGTLEFSYSPFYGYYGIMTGTEVSLSLGNITGYDGLSFGYYEIGAPTISTSGSVASPGETGFQVTVSNLIPSSGPSAPQTFYPGTSGYYNVYLGSSKVTSSVAPVTSTFSPNPTGEFSVTFTVPTMASGVYNASVTYAGQPVSGALPPSMSALVVVSTPGTSATSGTMVTVPVMYQGNFDGYLVAGYGFLPKISPTLTVYGSSGVIYGNGVKPAVPEYTGSYGGFADFTTLSLTTVLSQSAGTYELVLSEPFGTSTYEFYSSYSMQSSLMFAQTTLNPSAGTFNGIFYDFIGDMVTVHALGLIAGTYYDAYIGTRYVKTFKASPATVNGILEYSLGSFSVPIMPYGQYFFNLTYTGTMKVAASAPFYILPDYYGNFYLYTAQGAPTEVAFPGQILNFYWTPSVSPITLVSSQPGAIEFEESGLPAGTSWSVTLNTTTISSTTSSIDFTGLTAGTSLPFTVSQVSGYTVNPSLGTVTVIPGQTVTIMVTFTAVKEYSVTFTETGLPSGTSWSVTLAGTTESSTTSSIVFSEPNGSYAFTVGEITGYTETSSPASPITVDGAAASVSVTFGAIYALNFTESGLPAGTSWEVNLFSSRSLVASQTSTLDYINITGLAAGTYTFEVPSAGSYAPAPASGTLTLSPTTVTVDHTLDQAIAFQQGNPVTFTETGLASGTSWTVTYNGVSQSSTSSTMTFYEIGTASNPYSVYTIAGYALGTSRIYADEDSGTASTSSTTTITFFPAVTFQITGGTTVTTSTVSLEDTTTTTSVTAAFVYNNGVYFVPTKGDSFSFTAATESGYTANPSTGTFTWNGAALVIPITYTANQYTMTFTETGLTSGTSWSVTITPSAGSPITQSSSTDTISFTVTNGVTYDYSVAPVSGYTETSSPASPVPVSGADIAISVTFTAVTASYSVTFTETGLPSGTSWSVTLGRTPSSSTTSSIVFSGLPNGDYTFTASSSGYVANPSSGTVTVSGSDVVVNIVFSSVPTVSTPKLVSVVVNFNGSAYTEIINATMILNSSILPAGVALEGSFLAPNANNGTYWGVTLTWTTARFSYDENYFHTSSYTAYLQLVTGKGALLTGISSSEIATITADVTNAVTTSMQVPLSELNASVVAINGAVAKINTAFGNMTATLKSINATVASISSGQVLVLTKLGSVETSLASLNASLMSVSGNVATINTTLGKVQTSLSSIGTTVNSTATSVSGLVGSTATITSDLGTISGTVTSTSNGVATIQTSLGDLNVSVSQIHTSANQIKSSSSTLEIFLIVAIVLILITLVIAFLAVSNTNKLAKKFEEQKKQ